MRGEFQVQAIGFGGMNLSHAKGIPPDAKTPERLLLEVFDFGVDLLDTAALYGFGANEDLIGRVLSSHRSRFKLATRGIWLVSKGCMRSAAGPRCCGRIVQIASQKRA